MPINFKKANRYLPHILLIGLGIGTANFLMNGELNWFQWVIQSICTSLIIGYSLVLIAANKTLSEGLIPVGWQRYFLLALLFFIIGIIASEIEQVIRTLVFSTKPYTPFSGGRIYWFNGIISLLLGFSFFQNTTLFLEAAPASETELTASSGASISRTDSPEVINKIPIKQGENYRLIPLGQVAYFEAFDNYSFVHNLESEKRLCDYSLLFLEQRLPGHFVRVHRKYIVNTNHIQELRPHLNGRYVMIFSAGKLPPITSSKSYATRVRKLFRIS